MATNVHDAIVETYVNTGGLPSLRFGLSKEGSMNNPPFSVMGDVQEFPSYGSSGQVEYLKTTTNITVYGLSAAQARSAMALVRAALGPSSLSISNKPNRLYQEGPTEFPTGDRGPKGEYLFAVRLPLTVES